MQNNVIRNISWLLMATSLTACVTINIYFPAAAAEKAADKIIDDVWQLKDDAQPTVDKPSNPNVTPAKTTK